MFKKPDTGSSLAIQFTYKIKCSHLAETVHITPQLGYTSCRVQDANLHLLYIYGSCSHPGIAMFRSGDIYIQNIVPLKILPLRIQPWCVSNNYKPNKSRQLDDTMEFKQHLMLLTFL